MSFIGIELESFAPKPPAPEPPVSFSQDDVDAAYSAGFQAAEEQAKTSAEAEMVAALDRLAHELHSIQDSREDFFRQAIAALVPCLRIILEVSQPAHRVALVETQITELFERLGTKIERSALKVSCPSGIKDFVTACAKQAGVEDITLSESAGGDISIKLAGGEFRLCPAELRAELTALIDEFSKDVTHGHQSTH